ncbi:MAG: KH domain-containing protein [Polyangiaceae bacterium]|nr:KH domain-containing protein [Polyangiaceae bacterium]
MSDVEQELDQEWDDEQDDEGDDEGDADGDGAAEASEGGDDGAPRRRRRAGHDDGGPDWVPDNDPRALSALEFVATVVKEMEMDCRVRLLRPKEDDESPEINIEIAGPDAGRIIGKKGQVLMALQFLTHRVVNRSGLEKRHVLVDAEGYRSRRDSSLASMARRLGKQAVELGKIITFEPMNPRDRRVVHLALAKFEGVVTKSDGEGQSRRVQIIPVRRASAQSQP